MEEKLYDVMKNTPKKTINCLDKGYVRLIDVMPRLALDGHTTADYAIVQAARVSYGAGTKAINEDRGLIRYLMRHAHTTPFEMVEFKFAIKMPIFIARQIIRHRTSSVNEISGRYSILKDEFYIPEKNETRKQSATNKQGSDEIVDEKLGSDFSEYVKNLSESTYTEYERYIEGNISKEQARMTLPINLYTEMYWKCDLHNILHFLALRCDSHAQLEVRVFADAMLKLITPIVPYSVEAWNDYHPMRGAVKFTRLEMDTLRDYFNKKSDSLILDTSNKREIKEWEDKISMLGLKIN